MTADEYAGQEVANLVRSARMQLAQRCPEAALAALDSALQQDPVNAEANILRGMLCVGQKHYVNAVQYLRRAVTTDPSDGNTWMLLGAALFEAGHKDEALSALERACELAPHLASAWYNLGRTYKLVGRFADADETLRCALRLDPANTRARLTLADVEVALGRVDAGITHYRTLLRSEPENPRAWFGLANLKTHSFDAADTVCLRQAMERPGISVDARVLLGFALAKAQEDQEDYAAAWKTLQEANAREHHCHPWSRDQYRRNVTSLISAFASVPMCVPDSDRGREVIFIVSLPRSGSTLVEQILASHPEVKGANEINVLSDIVAGESKRRNAELADWISVATPMDWARLGEEYLKRTARFCKYHSCFTDKSLGTWEFLGVVRRMLPGARLVHCHRDPLENCFSCYRQWFSQGCKFSNDLDDLASYYADYRRLMEFWEERSPGDVFDLSYETLLAEPEATIRRLLVFCGLPYNAACLAPERTERAVASTASAAQVRQPIRRDTSKAQYYGALLDPLRGYLHEYNLA